MRRLYLVAVVLAVAGSITFGVVVDAPDGKAHGNCTVERVYFYAVEWQVRARGRLDCERTHETTEVFVSLWIWDDDKDRFVWMDGNHTENRNEKWAGATVKGGCTAERYALRVYGETSDYRYPFVHVNGPRNWAKTFTFADCRTVAG